MSHVKESDLPGIGRKFQIETRNGDHLVVVVHDNGSRELYSCDQDHSGDYTSIATLDDGEARQLGGIIGGMAYAPRALESTELALDALTIEWYKVEPSAKSVGKRIGDLQVRKETGAIIIAIIEKDHRQKISPGPDEVLQADSTLVVAGERHQVKALKQLVVRGSD